MEPVIGRVKMNFVRGYQRICFEEKRYPDGRQNWYRASVFMLQPGHGILVFVASQAYEVDGIYLPIGTVTFGLFWSDRPYNLYAWMEPNCQWIRALYFNVCDRTVLSANLFVWRDLWVDVLIAPYCKPKIIDYDEVPDTISSQLRGTIQNSVEQVIKEYPVVLNYLRALLPQLRCHFG